MNKLLSSSLFTMAAIGLLGGSSLANADHKQRNFDYARVVDARPIYQTVSHRIPVENCWVETVRVDHHGEDAAVVGGIIGAAIGHNLGHGKHHQGARTVAGAILGASIAKSATRDNHHGDYQKVQRCNTRYDVQRQRELVGYDVTYRYHGEIYHTRTDRHPGDRIRVSVSVRPAW